MLWTVVVVLGGSEKPSDAKVEQGLGTGNFVTGRVQYTAKESAVSNGVERANVGRRRWLSPGGREGLKSRRAVSILKIYPEKHRPAMLGARRVKWLGRNASRKRGIKFISTTSLNETNLAYLPNQDSRFLGPWTSSLQSRCRFEALPAL